MQVPDAFYRAVAGVRQLAAARASTRPASRSCPPTEGAAERVAEITAELAAEERLAVLGWREVPTDPTGLGPTARSVMPRVPAAVPGRRRTPLTGPLDLERRAFCLRKRLSGGPRPRAARLYFPSLSARTVVYKGMLTTDQLATFFPDLHDERIATAMALVHSRFSTNTFPSWPLAHPFRYIAHNGEINTIKRQPQLDAGPGGAAGDATCVRRRPGTRLLPVCTDGRVRLGVLRRGARAAAPGRPQPAARGADDDPGGLGEQRRDGPGPARVLRVPRQPDGAVGRPGLRHVHRRHA